MGVSPEQATVKLEVRVKVHNNNKERYVSMIIQMTKRECVWLIKSFVTGSVIKLWKSLKTGVTRRSHTEWKSSKMYWKSTEVMRWSKCSSQIWILNKLKDARRWGRLNWHRWYRRLDTGCGHPCPEYTLQWSQLGCAVTRPAPTALCPAQATLSPWPTPMALRRTHIFLDMQYECDTSKAARGTGADLSIHR